MEAILAPRLGSTTTETTSDSSRCARTPCEVSCVIVMPATASATSRSSEATLSPVLTLGGGERVTHADRDGDGAQVVGGVCSG